MTTRRPPPHRRVAGRILLAMLAALICAPALLVTRPVDAAEAPTLTIALTEDIDSLNPFQAQSAAAKQIERLMYDYLTAYDAKDEHPIGGLADRWSYSPDRLTWTYHIRTGEKWSDGQPVTAHDVAFTYNKVMNNPETWGKANGNFVTNFRAVTAPDDNTLIITTKAPQATMLALDIPIVPAHIWNSVKDVTKYTNDEGPVVDGPFMLTDHVRGQYVKLQANKDYWRGAPKVERLIFATYKSSDAAVAALRRGEVDMVSGLSANQAGSLDAQKNITVNRAPGDRVAELSFNPGAQTSTGIPIGNGNPALRDRQVRQALTYAVDKNQLVTWAEGGAAHVGQGYIPARYTTYHWTPPQPRKFDLKKADQLLDAAGYRTRPDGKRYGKDGKPLVLRFTGHVSTPGENIIGRYVAGWFSQLGIGMKVQLESDADYDRDTAKGDYDVAMHDTIVDPDPDHALAIQTCAARPSTPPDGSVSTDQYWCNPSYDRAYAQQLAEFDPTKRAATVRRMQQIMYDDVPADVLFYPDTLEAYRNDLFGGFQKQPEPDGQILDQDGFWGIYSATPLAAPEQRKTSDSGSTPTATGTDSGGGHGALIGTIVGIVVVLAIAAAVIIVLRRRKTEAPQ
jgi:peptide/nickel transport system substrate-binding protein